MHAHAMYMSNSSTQLQSVPFLDIYDSVSSVVKKTCGPVSQHWGWL